MLEKAEQSLPHKHTAGKYAITLAEVYFGWTSVKLEPSFLKDWVFLPDSCLVAGRQYLLLSSQFIPALAVIANQEASLPKHPDFTGRHFSSTPPIWWLPEMFSPYHHEKLWTAEASQKKAKARANNYKPKHSHMNHSLLHM